MDFLNNLPVHVKLISMSALPVVGAGGAMLLGASTGCDVAGAGWVIGALGAIAGLALSWREAQRIVRFQQAAIDTVNAIANGGGSRMASFGRDELGHLGYALENLRRSRPGETASPEVAENTARLLSALDVCDTNVMVADIDMRIVYLNKTAQAMFSTAEADLRRDLPSFSAAGLIGKNVDEFHANPMHQRRMVEALKDTFSTRIKVGGRTFSLLATPIFEAGRRLGTVIEWEDQTDAIAKQEAEERVNRENIRIRQALDSVKGNVMIGDGEHNIVYANRAWFDMMRNAEQDVRKELNNFSVDRVLGSSMDIFHKNPAHQRAMVERLHGTHNAQILVGGRYFSLTATPVMDAGGSRVGTVVEWSDRTDEVAIEREIDALVEAAGNGDFTRTIKLDGKSGFYRKLSEGLNALMETTQVGINDVIRVLGALAKGDLNEKITRDYQGDFGQLKRDANGTVEKLKEIITDIRQAATLISCASNEIAIGNTDLSQRTEEQASSLEETASSMEQMTSAVKQSAENARHANELAGEAQRRARQGGDVVSRAVQAMDEINRSSKKIADIIGVIDEIAFQTNLLALNAAVEAARAGEQGRGFAVVAGEVRNLAQRSAAAAKEIKDLIRDSVNKVTDGAQLVNHSGDTLTQIVEAVEKVSTMMREISDAAQEQTSGIEQVNTAVSQMDEMTQQNAALVEEASAAAEAMAEQAQKLSKLMDFFQIEGLSEFPQFDTARRTSHLRVAAGGGRGRGGSAAPARDLRQISSHASDDEWEEF